MQKLLKRLVSFESDNNHPEEIKRCFDYIIADLKQTGLKIKTYAKNKKPSLVASLGTKKHHQFILNGHLDVVPASYPRAYEPFTKNNRLYGRGAADMKGPVAVLVKLTKDLAKNHPQTDFALMITSDEEIGGFDGVKYLLEKKGCSCDCAIVPDGGRNFHLMLAEKGVLHVRIEAKGKTAHGSRPWSGDNALDKLIRVYGRIQKKMPKVSPKDSWKPTLNLGVMNGGDATNKVCDSAFAQLDFRYPKKGQKEKLLSLIKKEVGKEKGVKVTILVEGSVLINNPKDKYFKKVKEVARKHGRELKTEKEHGASDGRFFSEKGIPVIMFKPFCSGSHVDNEWIDLESLNEYYRILKDFILSFN